MSCFDALVDVIYLAFTSNYRQYYLNDTFKKVCISFWNYRHENRLSWKNLKVVKKPEKAKNGLNIKTWKLLNLKNLNSGTNLKILMPMKNLVLSLCILSKDTIFILHYEHLHENSATTGHSLNIQRSRRLKNIHSPNNHLLYALSFSNKSPVTPTERFIHPMQNNGNVFLYHKVLLLNRCSLRWYVSFI